MTRTFRCFAFRSRETWEAICADLDVAVFGGSTKEVMSSLETCIRMHLEGVSELPPDQQDHLLARRAPWYVWAKLAMITWLAHLRGDAERALRFSVESYLPPSSSASEQPPRQAGLAPDGRY